MFVSEMNHDHKPYPSLGNGLLMEYQALYNDDIRAPNTLTGSYFWQLFDFVAEDTASTTYLDNS